MKNLNGLSIEKINFEGSSIFGALEWECIYSADNLQDGQRIEITINETDMRENYTKTESYLPGFNFNYFFENCEENEFRWFIDEVCKVMLTEIFKDGNIEGYIFDEPKPLLSDMFRNLHG